MLRASTKRRFIAGAVCPACEQQDKLVLYLKDDQNVFECVSCGHLETLPSDLNDEVKPDDGVQAVKFIDP